MVDNWTLNHSKGSEYEHLSSMENNARSSSGRTTASDAVYLGSNPSLAVKKCQRCEKEKSLSEFNKQSTKPDGLQK